METGEHGAIEGDRMALTYDLSIFCLSLHHVNVIFVAAVLRDGSDRATGRYRSSYERG